MKDRYDAVLVHGYMQGEESDLGNRNYLQATALSSLYHDGRVGKTVVVGGQWWGNNNPHTFAEIFSKELQKRGVQNIVPVHKGRSTSEEIDTFTQLSQQHGWTSTRSLVTHDHQERVKVLNTLRPQSIDILVAEDIVKNAVDSNRLSGKKREEAELLLEYFANPLNTAPFRNKERVLTWLTSHGQERVLVEFANIPEVNFLKSLFDK